MDLTNFCTDLRNAGNLEVPSVEFLAPGRFAVVHIRARRPYGSSVVYAVDTSGKKMEHTFTWNGKHSGSREST